MVVPVGNQASKEIRPTKKRTVGGGGSPEHEVIAASGSHVPSIEHELFRRQTRLSSRVVEHGRLLHQFVPTRGGMQVGFYDAWIGCDMNVLQASVGWRWVAFEDDRRVKICRGSLDRGDKCKVLVR